MKINKVVICSASQQIIVLFVLSDFLFKCSPAAVADCPSQKSNLFLCFTRCELRAFFGPDHVILEPGGSHQGDGEAEQGAGQDIRGVMAIVRDPGEGGDSRHDEQSQLQPDPGQETAHLQPVLQIHLTSQTIISL